MLVPDDLGMSLVRQRPALHGSLYRLGSAPTAQQAATRAIVVGLPDVEATTAFVAELPALEIVQTLSAGYEQWVGRLPPGVALSNAGGAHGRAVAEWVVAVLLAEVRELHDPAEEERAHRWSRRCSGSLAGKTVLVLGAGDVGRHTAHLLEGAHS